MVDNLDLNAKPSQQSPLPWDVERDHDGYWIGNGVGDGAYIQLFEFAKQDADYIATACNQYPAMASLIRAQRERIERLESEHSAALVALEESGRARHRAQEDTRHMTDRFNAAVEQRIEVEQDRDSLERKYVDAVRRINDEWEPALNLARSELAAAIKRAEEAELTLEESRGHVRNALYRLSSFIDKLDSVFTDHAIAVSKDLHRATGDKV